MRVLHRAVWEKTLETVDSSTTRQYLMEGKVDEKFEGFKFLRSGKGERDGGGFVLQKGHL